MLMLNPTGPMLTNAIFDRTELYRAELLKWNAAQGRPGGVADSPKLILETTYGPMIRHAKSSEEQRALQRAVNAKGEGLTFERFCELANAMLEAPRKAQIAACETVAETADDELAAALREYVRLRRSDGVLRIVANKSGQRLKTTIVSSVLTPGRRKTHIPVDRWLDDEVLPTGDAVKTWITDALNGRQTVPLQVVGASQALAMDTKRLLLDRIAAAHRRLPAWPEEVPAWDDQVMVDLSAWIAETWGPTPLGVGTVALPQRLVASTPPDDLRRQLSPQAGVE
jgi:hypothetical protein